VILSEPRVGAGDVCWLEGRPSEGGRAALVRYSDEGGKCEVLPSRFYVRSRVHEYGGGAWARHGDVFFFSDFPSQRMFRAGPGSEPRPVTPEPDGPASLRYADADVSPDGDWIVCVREQHTPGPGVSNDIAMFPSDGSAEPVRLIGGHDFFSFPRFSPDGRALLWTTWDHPRMPWDGSDLWVAEFRSDRSLGEPRHLAGGPGECVFQPAWGEAGEVVFVSDRTGWGNLYAADSATTRIRPLLEMEAEFGLPQWTFGLSRYALLAGGRMAASYTRNGHDRVILLDMRTGKHETWELGYTSIGALVGDGDERIAVVGGSSRSAPELAAGRAGEPLTVLRQALEFRVDEAYLSPPRHIEYPTPSGRAYAFFYPPAHPDCIPPEGEQPPLIVTSHGGPTTSATSALNLSIRYWTSRGFGVVDVNYSGSTGYGRSYMERLRGRWGELDASDCGAAAEYLASLGEADRGRMAIRGRSASGLTTLCALVFHDTFRVGASYYGVADPETLARDTHKFESRYLDSLIGPYPREALRYRQRSPLAHASDLRTPVIFFQGLEDVVVPPSQAEAMIRVLDEKKLPYAYLTFEGEQHGFRKAASLRRSLEAELWFYSRILGFEPADQIEPIEIRNL
jgi:dipeptidyl aminopeptidase/acylaminoacyl peptidase